MLGSEKDRVVNSGGVVNQRHRELWAKISGSERSRHGWFRTPVGLSRSRARQSYWPVVASRCRRWPKTLNAHLPNFRRQASTGWSTGSQKNHKLPERNPRRNNALFSQICKCLSIGEREKGSGTFSPDDWADWGRPYRECVRSVLYDTYASLSSSDSYLIHSLQFAAKNVLLPISTPQYPTTRTSNRRGRVRCAQPVSRSGRGARIASENAQSHSEITVVFQRVPRDTELLTRGMSSTLLVG